MLVCCSGSPNRSIAPRLARFTGSRGPVGHANDHRMAAAVLEEILHRITQRMTERPPAKGAFKIGIAEAIDRLDGTHDRAPDKGGDRGRNPRDGFGAAGNLLDEDA